MAGYIYLGTDETVVGVKIGKTDSPSRREGEIRKMNPTFTAPLFFPVTDMNEMENMLHKKYEDKRLEGEWFDLSLDDVVDIYELFVGKIKDQQTKDTLSVVFGALGRRPE